MCLKLGSLYEVGRGPIGFDLYQLDLDAPFSGVKASGVGREFGPEGLAGHQALRSIFRGPEPDRRCLTIPHRVGAEC